MINGIFLDESFLVFRACWISRLSLQSTNNSIVLILGYVLRSIKSLLAFTSMFAMPYAIYLTVAFVKKLQQHSIQQYVFVVVVHIVRISALAARVKFLFSIG